MKKLTIIKENWYYNATYWEAGDWVTIELTDLQHQNLIEIESDKVQYYISYLLENAIPSNWIWYNKNNTK